MNWCVIGRRIVVSRSQNGRTGSTAVSVERLIAANCLRAKPNAIPRPLWMNAINRMLLSLDRDVVVAYEDEADMHRNSKIGLLVDTVDFLIGAIIIVNTALSRWRQRA